MTHEASKLFAILLSLVAFIATPQLSRAEEAIRELSLIDEISSAVLPALCGNSLFQYKSGLSEERCLVAATEATVKCKTIVKPLEPEVDADDDYDKVVVQSFGQFYAMCIQSTILLADDGNRAQSNSTY